MHHRLDRCVDRLAARGRTLGLTFVVGAAACANGSTGNSPASARGVPGSPSTVVDAGAGKDGAGPTSYAPGEGTAPDGTDPDSGAIDGDDSGETTPLRDVLLVGNSVSGTVSFLDGTTFDNLGSVNVIPDLQDRLAEIQADPVRSLAYEIVRSKQVLKHFEPANGDRFVDDVFVSPDGTKLYVSRSNLGDVAAFDLTTAEHSMLWHTRVDGAKADHAALSPDGTQLVVSATSTDTADVFDALTGIQLGSFATGHYPHQNDYSADGRHIYNGSIGDVSMPYADAPLKGVRQLTVVEATTLKVISIYPFTAGIRPTVITNDETTMYAQLSYLNGLIAFDLTTGTTTATLQEPFSTFATTNYPTYDDYMHDSAHHGLALSGDGAKLCDCGTIDNTVSIVSTSGLTVLKTIDVGLIPYWATTSGDGNYCFVSLSGDNDVSVIDYGAGSNVKTVPVGKFPQRSRRGKVLQSTIPLLSPAPG
jgi:YVTN family beta-propeller protein